MDKMLYFWERHRSVQNRCFLLFRLALTVTSKAKLAPSGLKQLLSAPVTPLAKLRKAA